MLFSSVQPQPKAPCFRLQALLVSLALISCTDGDLLEAQNESDALSPDDTLFAHLRCFERYASTWSQSDRAQDAADWLGAGQNYLHRTDRTPNFVKCVLTELGLYDPQLEAFNATVLVQQFNSFNRWMTLSEESVLLFVNETQSVVLENGSPEEVYEGFSQLFSNHSLVYFQLFLRDPTVLQKMHNQKFPVRKPNQTVIDFCEHRMGEDLWNDICHIRAYEISNRTEAMEAHITCVFRGFHYLSRGGSVNTQEILDDFAKAGVRNDASETHVTSCVEDSHQEPTVGKRSLRMYRCLLGGASADHFKEAFDFREIRSGNLSYLLHNLPYDRDQVKQQIDALDRERCDDQQRPTGRVVPTGAEACTAK